MEKIYEEYQGFDSLTIAEIIKDTEEAYETGTPEKLAPAGEISKTVATDSKTTYYDNQPYKVINTEGEDEFSLVTPILPIETVGKILGKTVDEATGALLDDGQPITKYFALSYRLLFTDGTYRYVQRHKVSFSLGDESAKSKDSSTDTNNQSFTAKGISTIHKFTKTGKVSKGIIVDEHDKKCDVSEWFNEVVTPDNIKPIATQ